MTADRSRRLERLLSIREQLERLAQWRKAAAHAARRKAEDSRQLALDVIDDRQEQLRTLLQAACPRPRVDAALHAGRQAEAGLELAETRLAERFREEQAVAEELRLARQRTRQSEKLAEAARTERAALEARALQHEWDEHALRPTVAGPVRSEQAELTTERRRATRGEETEQ
ncbi:MAG: hypothetical protein KF774_20025 [Planctomyces sp.]|nr:hypothetical protein [Planctomyces sp.]